MNILCLKVYFAYNTVVFSFHTYCLHVFLPPLTFNLPTSLYLKSISCRHTQHIACFYIFSVTLTTFYIIIGIACSYIFSVILTTFYIIIGMVGFKSTIIFIFYLLIAPFFHFWIENFQHFIFPLYLFLSKSLCQFQQLHVLSVITISFFLLRSSYVLLSHMLKCHHVMLFSFF